MRELARSGEAARDVVGEEAHAPRSGDAGAGYKGHDRVTRPEPLVETTTIGDLTIHAIQAGGQKLDGGAMFGVVPKPLWEKRIPADERNRIQLGMRVLLIEHPSG